MTDERMSLRDGGRGKSLWQRIVDVSLTDVSVLVKGLDEDSIEDLEQVLLEADFGGWTETLWVGGAGNLLAAVKTAIVRGGFEYQGQKCSAASRAYIPASLWPQVKEGLETEIAKITMGRPEDFRNFFGAVIDQAAFDSISAYIDYTNKNDGAEVIIGGGYDDSVGYFIEPTVILADNPNYRTMEEEIFGPVMTIYVYDDEKYEETLELCDQTSIYALTGAIFATERTAVSLALSKLENSAGNFYINDKPTGAVVGQQPFGGARASGTNDKAGSYLNLVRWVSPRTIKETFDAPEDFPYPFMDEE